MAEAPNEEKIKSCSFGPIVSNLQDDYEDTNYALGRVEVQMRCLALARRGCPSKIVEQKSNK
jgi:hypothetical protein